MIERLSVAASLAIHLALFLLAALAVVRAPLEDLPQNGMQIEIIDFEHAMPNPNPILAADPSASPPLASLPAAALPNPAPARPAQQPVARRVSEPVDAVRSLGAAPVAPLAASSSQLNELPRTVAVEPRRPPRDAAPANNPRLDPAVLARSLGSSNDQAQRSRLNSAAIGSAIGQAAPRGMPGLTIRQRTDLAAMVRSQVIPCWNVPASDAAGEASVKLRFRLDRQGRVVGQPSVSGTTGRTERNAPYVNLLTNSGRRAIIACSPLELPAELYEAWADVEVEFDPRDMR